MIQIGFTGTRCRMLPAQMVAVADFLGQYSAFIGHHGCAIGADSQFDGLARAALGFEHMVLYPMLFAGNKRGLVPQSPGDVWYKPQDPLVRNMDIARACDLLLATPKEMHMTLRSGTWTTIRYALQEEKPVFVVIPSGQVIPWESPF